MAKFPPNAPCHCGSGKKFKKCHYLNPNPVLRPVFQMSNEFGGKRTTINFFEPPNVYCDTNIWRSMTAPQLKRLLELRDVVPLKYSFSIVNYIEMISHLGSTEFHRVRSWFHRAHILCSGNVLPSPEWEFMASIGIDKYIHPCWIVNHKTVAARIQNIAMATSVDEIPDWKTEIEHYQKLRAIDETSFSHAITRIRSRVGNGKNNIRASLDLVSNWFLGCLAPFFLLTRPSNDNMRFSDLSHAEKHRFCRAFVDGIGQLFHAHCTAVLTTTFREGKKLDLNHLNDMLLLIQATNNQIFVTNEKLFFKYVPMNPQATRSMSLDELMGAKQVLEV